MGNISRKIKKLRLRYAPLETIIKESGWLNKRQNSSTKPHKRTAQTKFENSKVGCYRFHITHHIKKNLSLSTVAAQIKALGSILKFVNRSTGDMYLTYSVPQSLMRKQHKTYVDIDYD